MIWIFIIGVLLVWIPSRPRQSEPRVRGPAMALIDPAMASDLMAAALSGGSSIPTALMSLYKALGEEKEANGLDVTSRTLLMGGTWEEAWRDVPVRFDPLKDALEPAWHDGAAPLALLERSAATFRERRARRAREAAAQLGSKLVMPLGLCFLPAFVAIGIVPVIAAAGLDIFG